MILYIIKGCIIGLLILCAIFIILWGLLGSNPYKIDDWDL